MHGVDNIRNPLPAESSMPEQDRVHSFRTMTIACATAFSLVACAGLPTPQRIESYAITDTAQTPLGQAAQRQAAQAGIAGANDERSLVGLIPDGKDAFLIRAALATAAVRSLDVQYYIWHNDETGQLLMAQLMAAADRGVRVRLLLDDMHTKGFDEFLAAFDAHPNVEVRVYNPFGHRGARWMDYLGDTRRINRRMHNKAFIADGQAIVVGGRNVGNEYFAAKSDVAFGDLDAVAMGPIVPQVQGQFDRYWNSDSAYPVTSLIPAANPSVIAPLRESAARLADQPVVGDYVKALRESTLARDLVAGQVQLQPARATAVFDDPGKTLASASAQGALLSDRLTPLIADTREEMLLVSPYFVPRKEGTLKLIEAQVRGVRTTILTNSLASNDVGAVHAGYSKHREELLDAGISLWEVKPQPLGTGLEKQRKTGIGSSSSVSLHAKTFVFDRRKLFVGSYNLDPRSNELNTELGILYESPKLAGLVADGVRNGLPRTAWKVERTQNTGKLGWVDEAAGGTRLTSEPDSSWLQRTSVRIMRLLPIDGLL